MWLKMDDGRTLCVSRGWTKSKMRLIHRNGHTQVLAFYPNLISNSRPAVYSINGLKAQL